jgi:hypothetical protein
MAGLIPLETFPEDMAVTRGLVQRLNDVSATQGHVPAEAAIAATIETVGNLELELIALKNALGAGQSPGPLRRL